MHEDLGESEDEDDDDSDPAAWPGLLTVLPRFDALRELGLDDAYGVDLKPLESLSNLHSLALYSATFLDVDFSLPQVTQLTSVCVESDCNPNAFFPSISTFPSLEALVDSGYFRVPRRAEPALLDQLLALESRQGIATAETYLLLHEAHSFELDRAGAFEALVTNYQYLRLYSSKRDLRSLHSGQIDTFSSVLDHTAAAHSLRLSRLYLPLSLRPSDPRSFFLAPALSLFLRNCKTRDITVVFEALDAGRGAHHKFVKAEGSFVYFQWHYIARGGAHSLTAEKAGHFAGANPDYANEDLFRAIEVGDYPVWDAYVQVTTPEQSEKMDINILDLTKIWPHKEFPLRPVGKLVLNENPSELLCRDRADRFRSFPPHPWCRALGGPRSPVPPLLVPRHAPIVDGGRRKRNAG